MVTSSSSLGSAVLRLTPSPLPHFSHSTMGCATSLSSPRNLSVRQEKRCFRGYAAHLRITLSLRMSLSYMNYTSDRISAPTFSTAAK